MPSQLPIDLPTYTLTESPPIRSGEDNPPRAGEIQQTNQTSSERQRWFEAQLAEIGKAIGSRQIPWNFITKDGRAWRLDRGAVGHAMANGILVSPDPDTLLNSVELAFQVDMQMVVPTAKKRRVWLRAFWGFAPEDEGYLGFTLERNRERFLEEYKDGDLVLIYGADEKYTRLEQRQQLLGFLEVEPRRIQDLERSSDNDQKWKRENGFENRWTHALPVKRAWRINRRIRARHMASETFTNHQAILIASRGELLTSAEAQAVLSLPVSPTDVFGEVPLQAEQTRVETTLENFFTPSKGFTPNFGERNYTTEDGDTYLYVLDLAGNVANFLNRQPYEVARKAIVKIGIAKDPLDRCNTHNKHLPPACGYKWKVLLKSRTFSSAQEAKAVEDRIKETFPKIFESLGGEFYLVEEGRLQSEFALLAPAKFILKATNKSY